MVKSSVDVALWFYDQARKENDRLQPQMLQRILYIAQGSYAALYHGRKLMPAIFVAGETGPEDPNLYRLFERGRPGNIGKPNIPNEVEYFLQSIWKRYGHHTAEYLNQQIQHHSIYRKALKAGHRTEIEFADIVTFFTTLERPKVEEVRTADGRRLQKWSPVAVGSRKT